MPQESDIVDRVRVATPCTASWEKMRGNDRVRFCEQCNLNVYNFSALTRTEITNLVTQTEGRLCGRLYRRTDGTLLTRDCPTGLRGWYRRMAQRAGATLALLFGLTSGAWAQGEVRRQSKEKKKPVEVVVCETPIDGWKIERSLLDKDHPKKTAEFSGTLVDPMGAIIPNVKVNLKNQAQQLFSVVSDDNGKFVFSDLLPDLYTLEIISPPGFKPLKNDNLKIAANELIQVQVALDVGEASIGVVVTAEAPIEPEKTPVRGKIITRKKRN